MFYLDVFMTFWVLVGSTSAIFEALSALYMAVPCHLEPVSLKIDELIIQSNDTCFSFTSNPYNPFNSLRPSDAYMRR